MNTEQNQPIGKLSPHGVLLVVAAPKEADTIRAGCRATPHEPTHGSEGQHPEAWQLEPLTSRLDLVLTGVGKAQAAGGTIWAFDPARHGGVISLGIGGSLPGEAPPAIGRAVLATRSLFADEGVQTPDGFAEMGSVGFPPGSAAGGFGASGMLCSPEWAEVIRAVCDDSGASATVSTCSGTDAAARAIADRTGAAVENMEGAAVAAALSRLASPPLFAEIRVVSNTTGDRGAQTWDLEAAFGRLRRLSEQLADLFHS